MHSSPGGFSATGAQGGANFPLGTFTSPLPGRNTYQHIRSKVVVGNDTLAAANTRDVPLPKNFPASEDLPRFLHAS